MLYFDKIQYNPIMLTPKFFSFYVHDAQSVRVRRVVGTIWNVGAGDPSSRPVRNAKYDVGRDGAPCVAADS